MAPARTTMVGAMTVSVHRDDLAETAAADVAAALRDAVRRGGVANAMFATGNSQLAMIDALVARPDVPWSDVVVFHMDEYVGIGPQHPAGFRHWITTRIVDRVQPRDAHLFDGTADPDEEARRYAALLASNPIDVCCLGIGENGHLAFNDPHVARFDDPLDVKVVELDDACRRQQVGEGHFPDLDAVPPLAITVTIPALLRARDIRAVVPDARKAEAVRCALEGPLTTTCPASVLRRCGQVHLYLDPASASALDTSSWSIEAEP